MKIMTTKPVRTEEKRRHATPIVDNKVDLRTINPNLLKDRLYKALIGMTESDRSAFSRRLFTALSAAGINVHNHMLLLGCNANQLLDATANDIALLVRYYRVNFANLLDIIATVLDQFPAINQGLVEVQSKDKAA